MGRAGDVVTSLDSATLEAVGLAGPPEDAVVGLAKLAIGTGADGMCTPHEVGALHSAVGPGPLLVIPGVRPAGAAKDDQARVASRPAVRAVADVLVIGRPLREGGDPVAAARRIAATL